MHAASLWSWYCSCVGLGLLCREPTATVIRPLFAMHLVIDQERADLPMDRLCPPCLKVLVITHEKARVEDMSDYFTKKFAPLEVLYLVGRSYKASPTCTPDETLFDLWKDLGIGWVGLDWDGLGRWGSVGFVGFGGVRLGWVGWIGIGWVGLGWNGLGRVGWIGSVGFGGVRLGGIGLGPVGWVGGARWGWVGSDGLGSLELGLVGLGWVEWIVLGLRGRAYRLPSMSALESTTSSSWRSGLRVMTAPKRRLSCACLGGAKNIPTLDLPFTLPSHPNPSHQVHSLYFHIPLFLPDRPTPQRLIRTARRGTSTR